MAEEGFAGNSGNRISHYDRADNRWGLSINKSIEAIARAIDTFQFGVEDVAREVTAASGRRFEELNNELKEFVQEYNDSILVEKNTSTTNLSEYIDLRLDPVIASFIEASQRDLTVSVLMKAMLQNQLRYIEDSMTNLKSQFDQNLLNIADDIALATADRDSIIESLSSRVSSAEALLDSHIENKENPHNTEIEQLSSNATVYQNDPDNSTSLIEPPDSFDLTPTYTDRTQTAPIIDSPAQLLGMTLGLGEPSATLGDDESIGTHYYISFHAVNPTFVDSDGDTGTYILSGGFLEIVFDALTTKSGLLWSVGEIAQLLRLDQMTITAKYQSGVFAYSRSIFVLYFASAPYPNLLAQMMGIETRRLYITDGTDDTINWPILVDGSPASWVTDENPNTGGTEDYWIEFLDIEPVSKVAHEGSYTPAPNWVVSAYAIETEIFVDQAALGLPTFDWWAIDSNGNYIKVKFSGTVMTFIYDMFERVLVTILPSSSSSGAPAYEPIPTLSHTVEAEWTFPDDSLVSLNDQITVANKRRVLQDGTDAPVPTGAGTFNITRALRFLGN